MSQDLTSERANRKMKSSSLMVRLDDESRGYLSQAAQLRKISVSDYVREVTVAQARREVELSITQTIALSPTEQMEFWTALNEAPILTKNQE